jgi:hypothetical protein
LPGGGSASVFFKAYHLIDRVSRNVAKLLLEAAGPLDFDFAHQGVAAQPEMEARVIGGVVASSPADFVNLSHLRRIDGEARADRSAIALGADETKQNTMIRVLRLVEK